MNNQKQSGFELTNKFKVPGDIKGIFNPKPLKINKNPKIVTKIGTNFNILFRVATVILFDIKTTKLIKGIVPIPKSIIYKLP